MLDEIHLILFVEQCSAVSPSGKHCFAGNWKCFEKTKDVRSFGHGLILGLSTTNLLVVIQCTPYIMVGFVLCSRLLVDCEIPVYFLSYQ